MADNPAESQVDDRAMRASRRAVLKTGILGSMVVAAGGSVAAAFSAVAGRMPGPWRVKPLRSSGGARPRPVLHETGDVRTDFFLAEYPASGLPEARKVYDGAVLRGMEAGAVAVSRRCPHLGDPVAWCSSSQWFECPTHGSQFNAVGEKKGGPAPYGLNLFAVDRRADGDLDVDTQRRFQGAPIGTNTTGQEAEGWHCVGGGE